MAKPNRYLRINFWAPRAEAQCDYSGVICMRDDLRPQMEYAGKGLINTGFMVHHRFLDIPNPQNLAPPIKNDPEPVNNPRPILYFDNR